MLFAGALLPVAFGAQIGAAPALDTEALRAHLEELRPRQLGVDHAGRLWAYAPGRAVVFDDAGQPEQVLKAPSGRSVDVDGEWGVLVLSERGTSVTSFGVDGKHGVEVSLDDEVASVAWVGPSRIAVGSTTGADRVEIWSLTTGRRLAGIDQVGPLPRGPGARPSRSTAIRFLGGIDRYVILDRFQGHLAILDADGGLLHEAQARDPRRAELDAYMAGRDAEAKRQGREDLLPFERFWLGVEPSGAAWTVESRDPDGYMSLLRLAPDGEIRRVEMQAECASGFFVVWGQELIFCQHPVVSSQPCCSIRRIP